MIVLLPFLICCMNECKGNNTVIGNDGFCECVEGFPYGDPESDVGCFNCNIECHINGECSGQNICKCKPGYIGDGIKQCDPRFPLPKNASPENCTFEGGVNILIKLESSVTSNLIFCKFGETLVAGTYVSNDTVQCLAPMGNPGNVELKISDNSDDWNLPGIPFYYFQKRNVMLEAFPFIIATLIMFTVLFFVISCLRSKAEDVDETMPFVNPKADSHKDLSVHGFFPL